jgi:hypothetical protein
MFPDDTEAAREQHRRFVLDVLEGRSPIRLSWPVRQALSFTPGLVKRRLAEWLRGHFHVSTQMECPVRTLSEVLAESHVERIDLLKLDVEAAESDVLAGLEPRDWPLVRQIVLEVHGGADNAKKVCSLLRDRGFRIVCEADPVRPLNFMVYGLVEQQ